MPTEDENLPLSRRIAMRRSRGGFGGGSSTQSESLRAPEGDEQDAVDNAIEPEVVHERIVDDARMRPMPAPRRAPALPPPADAAAAPPDPRERMHQVAQSGSAAFSKEYRHTLLHRMLMRRIPLDQIARDLGVSVSTIEKDRVELKERLRTVARELDINEIVGNQMGVYDELSGMAMRIAGSAETPIAMKLAGTRTVLASEADRTRFLNTAGVFDVLRFRKSEDGSDVSDVQRLMESTDNIFKQLMAEEVAPQKAAAPRRTVRPARVGGFAPLTMDDRNASSGDAETVEI